MVRSVTWEEDIFTEEEIAKIVNTIRNTQDYLPNTAGEFQRKRDETLFLFRCYSGLRPGEALTLCWTDIDFEKNIIRVNPYSNKQRNAYTAQLGEAAKTVLLSYKLLFDKLLHCPYVFPSLISFEPLKPGALNKRYRNLMKQAGIQRIIGYTQGGNAIYNHREYSTRKYFGTKFYEATKDTYATMRALRQTQINSIRPYVNASKKVITEGINKAFPTFASNG